MPKSVIKSIDFGSKIEIIPSLIKIINTASDLLWKAYQILIYDFIN